MRANFVSFSDAIDTIENGFPFWKVYALVDNEADDYDYRATVSFTKGETDLDADEAASELRKVVKGLLENEKVNFFKLVVSKFPTATGKDRQTLYFRYGATQTKGKRGQEPPPARGVESLGAIELAELGFITREDMRKEMRYAQLDWQHEQRKKELDRREAELKEIENRFREADSKFNSDAAKLGAAGTQALYGLLGRIPMLNGLLEQTHFAGLNGAAPAVEPPVSVKPDPQTIVQDPIVNGLENGTLSDNDLWKLQQECQRQLLNRKQAKNGAESGHTQQKQTVDASAN